MTCVAFAVDVCGGRGDLSWGRRSDDVQKRAEAAGTSPRAL